MIYTKDVLDSNTIAKRFADLYEQVSGPAKRTDIIYAVEEAINSHDYRRRYCIFAHLRELGKSAPSEARLVQAEVEKFIEHKKRANGFVPARHEQVGYPSREMVDDNGRTYTRITQEEYDAAAIAGFPSNFFAAALLDNLQIYALPDNANFSSSKITHCTFNACRCVRARFVGAEFDHVEFSSMDMSHCNFSGAVFVHCRFRWTELRGADFTRARFYGGYFYRCSLVDVDFASALFGGTDFCRIIPGALVFNFCFGQRHDRRRHRHRGITAPPAHCQGIGNCPLAPFRRSLYHREKRRDKGGSVCV